MDESKTFMVENAQLIFRNFQGKEGLYNREGERDFSVFLPEDVAEDMLKEGWNVKYLASREEGDPDRPYVQVSVNFKNRPPRIFMITSAGRIPLNEESVGVLDWADFENVDLIARGYEWNVNGKGGIKAYLQSMYATIEEDALARKYAELESEDR